MLAACLDGLDEVRGLYQTGWVCNLQVLGQWLLGMMGCAVIVLIIQRSNGLHDYHKTPILSMVLGLMLGCGCAGWYSLAGIGGHQLTWLACWETWILLHLLAVCYPTLLGNLLSPSQQPFQQPSAGPEPCVERSPPTRHHDDARQPMHIADGSSAQQSSPAQKSGVREAAERSGQRLSASLWQHSKKPLFCILMGLAAPALTGWLPCQISLAQNAIPAAAEQQPVPHGGMTWVDLPLQPHW